MEIVNISILITATLGGVSALAPVIKAISHWHIELKKMSTKEEIRIPHQQKISKAEVSGGRFRMMMLINSFIGGLLGMFLLIQQSMDSGPVTKGSLAATVLGVIYIYLGWIKKQPWE